MKPKFYAIGIAVMCLLLSVADAAAQLSPKLQSDMELIQLEKSSRTPTERKIDSKLLQALRESRGQKMVPGVDLDAVKVNSDATGAFKVDISADVTDEFLKKLQLLGAKIIFPSAEYHTVRATIKFSMVETIAAFPEVKFIQEAVQALGRNNNRQSASDLSVTNGQATSNPATKPVFNFMPKKAKLSFEQRAEIVRKKVQDYVTKNVTTNFFAGTIANSQGDRSHRTDEVRSNYGYQGQGIKIGILSDSYDALGVASVDVKNSELPGPGNLYGNNSAVTVLADYNASDEGRAMLQIVHDIAPQAQLYFATAFISEASFASNIIALRNTYGCDIIIDDIFYYDEPVFQDGIVAQAVNTVTAAGALYFSAAGNEGSVTRNTGGYYEGDFNDAGSPAFTYPGGAKSGTIHNFGTVGAPLNGNIITLRSDVYALFWADPAGASANDYDLFIVSATGTIKAQSTNIQNGTGIPFEGVNSPTLVSGDRFVVFKSASAAVRAFAINTFRGRLAIPTTGQTHGHSAAVDAYSVAATPASTPFGATVAGPYPGPFVNTNQTESFSSDGPRRIFFTPAGAEITPGNLLFGTNGGVRLNKPDITAADGVATTLAPSSGLNPFYGTSAAAPHAGAIAALIKCARPSITPAQMRTLLTSTALDIETPGLDIVSGAGILQPFQAFASLAPTPVSNLHRGTITFTEGSPTNGNGNIDAGEQGRIVVQLLDPTGTAAGSVVGTLTTTTPGITITQATATYGTIAANGNAANTATPFIFNVNPSVACGTEVNFSLSVAFTNGGAATPRVFTFSTVIGGSGSVISSTLGGTPPVNPGYVVTSGQQLGRLTRNGQSPTVCNVTKANPGLTVTTGSRQYDAYRFTNTNTAPLCVTVNLAAANGLALFPVAYNNSGFVPSNPSTNYLADPGSSSADVTFSFTVPAAESFTVVVHDVNVTPASNSPYTLRVSLPNCVPAVLPLTWLDVSATLLQNKQVAVNWKVGNEQSVSRYEIESSTDGIHFTNFAAKPASNNNVAEKSYVQVDPQPADGRNYYRVKQIDVDGKFSYSKTVTVNIENKNTVSVKPNPATTFVLVQYKSSIRRIQMFSSTGQLVRDVVPNGSSYELPVGNLTPGQYLVRIQTKDGVINKKIIKE